MGVDLVGLGHKQCAHAGNLHDHLTTVGRIQSGDLFGRVVDECRFEPDGTSCCPIAVRPRAGHPAYHGTTSKSQEQLDQRDGKGSAIDDRNLHPYSRLDMSATDLLE